VIEDVSVVVCRLCGHLHGDDERVAEAERRREARERGFAPEVYPLVKALEGIATFQVAGASAGRPEVAEYPYVFLRLAPEGLRDLERLLTSLEMANRSTRRRWVIECTLQRGLLFILRPRFWKPVLDVNAKDIAEAREDLPVLARTIERDVRLTWWTT
jgi:hypothetical protein